MAILEEHLRYLNELILDKTAVDAAVGIVDVVGLRALGRHARLEVRK